MENTTQGCELERDTETERQLRCAMALLVGWNAPRFVTFCRRFAPMETWFEQPPPCDGDEAYDFVTAGQRRRLEKLHQQGARSVVERVNDWSGQVIVYGDDGYPQRFEQLDRAPAAIHLLGPPSALVQPSVAVVGSRKIPVGAASSARRILQPVARQGIAIVSGGALGADAVAHRAAVDASATTVVVLPSGLHNPSPKSNRRLFRDVADSGGALISEYPPDEGVRRYHFRRRNSLIAALSRGVLVLRAGAKSGTMLTVEAARRLDRPLAAVPGPPDDPLSAGCHQILRDGGRLIVDSKDLMEWCNTIMSEELALLSEDAPQKVTDKKRPDCEVLDEAESLLDVGGAFSVEQLARHTDKTAAELQSILLEHELAGVVERVPGGGKYRFCPS